MLSYLVNFVILRYVWDIGGNTLFHSDEAGLLIGRIAGRFDNSASIRINRNSKSAIVERIDPIEDTIFHSEKMSG